MDIEILELSCGLPVRGFDAGIVISRSDSRHIKRVHSVFDLLFVREGILSIREENRDFEVGPGQTLLLWPNRPHQGTKVYPQDLRYFWLHFEVLLPSSEAPVSSKIVNEVLSIPQFTTVKRPDYLSELFLRYIHEQGIEPKTGTPRFIPSTLLLLLMLHEISHESASKAEFAATEALAGRALTYIRIHYRRALTPGEIASHVGCTPQYLSRIFRRSYGQTMTDAIHQARLEYARFLLLETDQNVSEIAYSCGFTDTRYFYRQFRRYEGMTALAYRKLHTRRFINVE